jgi:hypothetical protein
MLRLDFLQEADCYVCFDSHILAAHHFECVFDSETFLPPIHFIQATHRYELLCYAFRNRMRLLAYMTIRMWSQLYIYVHQAFVLRPTCVPEK